MKKTLKILLITFVIIGGLYIAISHFIFLGTSEDEIEQYDYNKDFSERSESLTLSWSKQDFNILREMYADLAIVESMGAISKDSLASCYESLGAKADMILCSFFNQNSWNELDLPVIKRFAQYIGHDSSVSAVDGYYSIQSLILSSQSCKTQDQVEKCISESVNYLVLPWTNCTNLKNALNSIPNTAMTSYTNKTLLPKCKKMNNFRSNYSYFDDFDADYQLVKKAQEFLKSHNYTNNSLYGSFKTIKYNDAANALDPKFF